MTRLAKRAANVPGTFPAHSAANVPERAPALKGARSRGTFRGARLTHRVKGGGR